MQKSQIKNQEIIFNQKSRKTKNYRLENFHFSYLGRVFEALNIPGEGKYLDVGCGALGHLVIEAARKGQKAVGLDLTRTLIDKARKFSRSELEGNRLTSFFIGQAERLPFKNQSFTKVSAIALLEHIENDERVISEIARVLKPGGRMFVMVPNSYQKINPFFAWYYRRVDKEMGHLRHYEGGELKKRFEKYGLKLVCLNYTGHFPKTFQYLLTLVWPRFAQTKWWWSLESVDLKMSHFNSGLHFDLVMEKLK